MNGLYIDDTGCYVTAEFMNKTDKNGVKNVASFICKNHKKAQAERMQIWGADKLPDEIKYYKKINENLFKIPLGWYGFDSSKFENRFSKAQTYERKFIGTLREDQEGAIGKLLSSNIGLLKASTGVGKGVMIPYLVAHLKMKTLIVVPGIQLLNEMVERIQTHIGVTPRTIGGKKQPKKLVVDESIVISTIESSLKIDISELRTFRVVLMDECDKYVTTDNRIKFIESLSPIHLYGFTGTTKLNYIDGKVLKIFFGPQSDLIKLNFTPQCFYVKTEFEYSEGELQDAKEFTSLNNEITEDNTRNDLISQTVLETLPQSETRKGLILTNRVEHSNVLKEKIEAMGIEAYIIVGETKKEERDKIISYVKSTDKTCVIIGNASILGRGFDLPALQIVYIAYPNRFESNVIQSCGRVIRNSPGKTYCQVYDFIDPNVQMLKNQGKNRHRTMCSEYGLKSVIQYIPGSDI